MFNQKLMKQIHSLICNVNKKLRKNKKDFDYNELYSVIYNCRSLGVQELRVGELTISFFPILNSDLTPSKKSDVQDIKPVDTNPIIPNDRADLIDSVMLCDNPSEFMRLWEKQELRLDKDFGNGTGEEV